MIEGMLIREVGVDELKQLIQVSTKEAVANIALPNPERLLSQKDVTAKFGIKRTTLLALHKAGKLCYKKIGSSNVWLEGGVREFVQRL